MSLDAGCIVKLEIMLARVTSKNGTRALASVAQWIECRPVNRSVTGWIPSQAHAWIVGWPPPPVGGALEATTH